MLRYFTAGESHGEALVAFISGIPAGLRVEQIGNFGVASRATGEADA
jgi:chorismate synthase